MTLRNCITALLQEFVWEYDDRKKLLKIRGKIRKSTYLSCCVYNLCFYGVWKGFRAITVGFSFSVFFSIYMYKEEYREADRLHSNHPVNLETCKVHNLVQPFKVSS